MSGSEERSHDTDNDIDSPLARPSTLVQERGETRVEDNFDLFPVTDCDNFDEHDTLVSSPTEASIPDQKNDCDASSHIEEGQTVIEGSGSGKESKVSVKGKVASKGEVASIDRVPFTPIRKGNSDIHDQILPQVHDAKAKTKSFPSRLYQSKGVLCKDPDLPCWVIYKSIQDESSSLSILKENCQMMGLKFRGETPRDGNCFFEAVSSQLQLNEGRLISPKKLRQDVITFLKSNRQFNVSESIIDLAEFTGQEDYDGYCDRMARDGEWVDHVVVDGMARMLQRNIKIVTSSPSSDPDSIIRSIQPNFQGQPILLGHEWETHYHSLQTIEAISSEPASGGVQDESQNDELPEEMMEQTIGDPPKREKEKRVPTKPGLYCVLNTNNETLTLDWWYYGKNFVISWQWKNVTRLLWLMQYNKSGVVHCTLYPRSVQMNDNLSSGAMRIAEDPNLGGSSEVSEAMAFEVLRVTFNARLLKTEKEILYYSDSTPKLDFVCEINGTIIGVSVTRAFNKSKKFTEKKAMDLLKKKLNGIVTACMNTREKCARQILMVWIPDEHKDTIVKVLETLSNTDTTVILVGTQKSSFVLCNVWANYDLFYYQLNILDCEMLYPRAMSLFERIMNIIIYDTP